MTTKLFLFPFFFLFFFFRVTKFGMLLILTEKSGFIQQQSCFSSLLARAIDKISVWGPYAILAGPDGFFRTCSRHHVRPSYGDFLNSFAMKARAGPYGSYNKSYYCWLVQFFYIYFFLTRVFGNFYFIPCYLPLFPFDLFGLNLEFEPFHSKRNFS